VHAVARRIHADLLRRSRAAENGAHDDRRDPRAAPAARRLHDERIADEPRGEPFAAQRDRPAHRAAGRPQACARGGVVTARDGATRCARARALARGSRAPEAAHRVDSVPRRDRPALPLSHADAPAGKPGGDVLPNGRLGVDGRAQEGSRQALLRAAAPVPVAQVRAARDRLHPAHRRRRGGRRAPLLSRPQDRRHRRAVGAGADAPDHRGALSARLVEHLRGAALRRRRLRCRPREEPGIPRERVAAGGAPLRVHRGLRSRLARLHAVGGVPAHPQRHLRDARGAREPRHLAGVPRPVRQAAGARGGAGVTTMATPISTGAEWTFDLIARYDEAIAEIAVNEFGLDCYPNQIEVISSAQMLDAYASTGLPIGYPHWSFGKAYIAHEHLYRRGARGLAYEIVINSNPCIAYLMEENPMPLQALVIAHASYGHNSFFKGNYLFRHWTQADPIIASILLSRRH